MTKKIGMRLAAALALATATLGWPGAAGAHHEVLRFNLEEMTVTADRVFIGKCVAVDETNQNIAQGLMPVTRYTFDVERALKGSLPKRLTFRQLGHRPHRSMGKGNDITMHGQTVTPTTFIHGMAEYEIGDRYVLFLIPNYMDGAVTYPVGLYQGSFRIATLASGQQLARNAINNLELFTAKYNGTTMKQGDGMVIFPDRDQPLESVGGSKAAADALLRKRGALPVTSLVDLVVEINAAHRGTAGEIVK